MLAEPGRRLRHPDDGCLKPGDSNRRERAGLRARGPGRGARQSCRSSAECMARPDLRRRVWRRPRRVRLDPQRQPRSSSRSMYAVNWDLIDRLGLDRTALAGQTALVTGGARGIGEGARHDDGGPRCPGRRSWTSARPARPSSTRSTAGGGQAQFIECDLSVVDEVMAMIPQGDRRLRPDRHPGQQRAARRPWRRSWPSTWRSGRRRSRPTRARRSC